MNSNKDVSSFGNVTIKSFSHGDSYALLLMAQKLGISEILDSLLPPGKRDGVKRSTSLILAAIHRAASPGSKRDFCQWFERASIPWQMDIRPQVMTSQHFRDQMDGISQEDLRRAEDTITRKILEMLEMHYICSFSLSYCKELHEIDLCEYEEIKLEKKIVKILEETNPIQCELWNIITKK